MTAELWGYGEPVTKTVLSDESRQVTAGTIAVRGDQLVWQSAGGAARMATPTGPEASAVRLVLAHPKYAEVRDVRIELREAFLDGKLIGENSRLVLHSKPALGEVAYVVSKDTLTPEALAALSKGLLGDSRVPRVFRDLASSLRFFDLGAALGRSGAHVIESQVFLLPDGKPAFTSPHKPEDDAAETSVPEQLDRLSRVAILMQLEGPSGTLFVRGQPDRLWLHLRLGSVGSNEGELRMPLDHFPMDPAQASVVDEHQLPAEFVHVVATYSRARTAGSDMSLGHKIALTPLALVFDILLGGILGDDDDDDELTDRERQGGW